MMTLKKLIKHTCMSDLLCEQKMKDLTVALLVHVPWIGCYFAIGLFRYFDIISLSNLLVNPKLMKRIHVISNGRSWVDQIVLSKKSRGLTTLCINLWIESTKY